MRLPNGQALAFHRRVDADVNPSGAPSRYWSRSSSSMRSATKSFRSDW